MQKAKLFKRSVPLWVFIVTLIASASIVIAAVVFTSPTVLNTMSLGASYTLELSVASEKGTQNPTSWVLVPTAGTSLDWGIFNEDDSFTWWIKVKNVGNTVGNICWRKTGWDSEAGKWELQVQENGITMLEGVTKPLAFNAEMKLMLYIHELTAEAGVLYSFGVFIENNDAPLP